MVAQRALKFNEDNLGVGDQLASHMLPRISSQVLPLKSSLVIWQTGVNDAIRGVEIGTFRKTLELGIDELRVAKIGVVLVDIAVLSVV